MIYLRNNSRRRRARTRFDPDETVNAFTRLSRDLTLESRRRESRRERSARRRGSLSSDSGLELDYRSTSPTRVSCYRHRPPPRLFSQFRDASVALRLTDQVCIVGFSIGSNVCAQTCARDTYQFFYAEQRNTPAVGVQRAVQLHATESAKTRCVFSPFVAIPCEFRTLGWIKTTHQSDGINANIITTSRTCRAMRRILYRVLCAIIGTCCKNLIFTSLVVFFSAYNSTHQFIHLLLQPLSRPLKNARTANAPSAMARYVIRYNKVNQCNKGADAKRAMRNSHYHRR